MYRLDKSRAQFLKGQGSRPPPSLPSRIKTCFKTFQTFYSLHPRNIIGPKFLKARHFGFNGSLWIINSDDHSKFECLTSIVLLFSINIRWLKLVSTIFYQIFIFHQMITLQKLWKMFFISSKKLFSFLEYLHFSIFVFPSFFPCQPLL